MASQMNFPFDFKPRPLLRLRYIEDVLLSQRIVEPVPSRQHLINLIKDGELEGRLCSWGWSVYEDSFVCWVHGMQIADQEAKPKLKLVSAIA